MSERDTAERKDDVTVSPYLLRPVRSYDQYLRDRQTPHKNTETVETSNGDFAVRAPHASRAVPVSHLKRCESADNRS